MSYEKILINGEPYLFGEPEFENVHSLGLTVGDRIIQVGTGGGRRSGKQTSSASFDNFTPWIEYAGWHAIEDVRYMAFKLPPGGVCDRNKKTVEGNFYKLYIMFKNGDLLVPNHRKLTTLLYRGNFLRFQERVEVDL